MLRLLPGVLIPLIHLGCRGLVLWHKHWLWVPLRVDGWSLYLAGRLTHVAGWHHKSGDCRRMPRQW